ncbi:lipopolysaccharide biosynthesis protein [Nitrospira sp. BLG_1]|uniref:lipopolysaccharide biosynthesis protein n=1 Tax=Nitrospira sp. BLG_1 TaxID=3395883 RepID=UPI0039BCD932
MKDLKERTLRGAFAKFLAQGTSFILRIGSLMVLARLLDPKDFGLVGMVTVVTGVFSLFKDAGLSTATVQRPAITNEQVSALFWINILVGTVLGLLSLAIAPVLVSFYHEPRLFWVTAALSTGFIFNAAGVQHSALLQRQMRFATLSAVEIISLIVSTAVGISLAIGGHGYWALVGMAVVTPATSSVCLWLATSWVPGKPRRGEGIGSMIRFGGTATLNSLVVYVAYNVEKALLGRFWGTEALGVYGRAYQLINIPTENINSASGVVALAALSRLQSDPERFKKYFLKGYSITLALTLPVTITCGLFANDLILILLGPKWKEVVPIFQMLTPTILVFALINPMWWLLASTGRVERSLKIALVIAPLVIGAYLIGLPYGPIGVAAAYSTVMILWLVPHIAWCINGTSISAQDILKVSIQPAISALAATVLSIGAHLFYGQFLSPLLRLLLGSGILVASYLWMLLYVMGQKTFYLDMLQSLKGSSSAEAAI